MTAYVASVAPDHVSIAADSAIYDTAKAERCGLADKVHYSASAGGLMACTGHLHIAYDLLVMLLTGRAGDFDATADAIAERLPKIYDGKGAYADTFWLGWSPSRKRFAGHLLTSDGRNIELPPGVYLQPPAVPTDGLRPAKVDHMALLRKQRGVSESHIGGPCFLWRLDRVGLRVKRLGTLDKPA